MNAVKGPGGQLIVAEIPHGQFFFSSFDFVFQSLGINLQIAVQLAAFAIDIAAGRTVHAFLFGRHHSRLGAEHGVVIDNRQQLEAAYCFLR